jgi:hypothetical protein
MTLMRIHPGLEMTEDRVFAHRVRRLVAVSSVALGVIWVLAFLDGGPPWVLVFLAAGWVLMPTVLAASLHRPMMRYALIVPATVVPVGLIGMVTVAPASTVDGWIVMAAGIVFGGFLGMWFWFRWLPVPRTLDDPFGWPRVTLVGIHIALVLAGVAIVAAGL